MQTIDDVRSAITEAAAAFLSELSDQQRQRATLPFEDETERRTWHYTPTPRPGLSLREMSAVQQQRVRRLIAASLSEAGYNHLSIVIGLEYVIDHWNGFPERPYGNLDGTRMRDPGNYCVAVFGTPGADRWSWRIGGHHVSLHVTLHDGVITPLPAFFGVEPARTLVPGGVLLRPLAAEEDLARALLTSLRPDQHAKAVIAPVAPIDMVQTNAPRVQDGALPWATEPIPLFASRIRTELGLTPEDDELVRYTSTPRGLPATAMDAGQRETLIRLLGVYLEHFPEPVIAQYAWIFQAGHLDTAAFAWAGPAEPGAPHYYRIQSDRLLIEYDCTQDGANHTHSTWRDLHDDFGGDLLAAHYAESH